MPRSAMAFALRIALVVVPTPALAHPPSGIVVDRHGNVYFVVVGSNAILRLGRDGRVTQFTTDERLRLPHHLVLGADGSIYSASDDDGRVWHVSPEGKVREHFNSSRIRSARRTFPPLQVGSGGDPFTVDSAGNVFALGPDRNSIVRIALDGTTLPVAAHARLGELHFSSMQLDRRGVLYLSDANRVWRIVGDSATAIVPRGIDLSTATGIAIDSIGNIYVADYSAGRVTRFAPDGSVNTPRGLTRLRVSNPTGVTISGDAVYVLDSPHGSSAIWRVQGEEARRLYSQRRAGAWASLAFKAAILTLVILLGAHIVQRRRARAVTPRSA